ncbi:MAG: SGNH/GDSL hydrolase family protein [Sphingomonas fennica]
MILPALTMIRPWAVGALHAAIVSVAILAGSAASAQRRPAPAAAPAPSAARTILFVGNSFTEGARSPVRTYRPDSVIDLNGSDIGGIPALFKRLTQQAGLDYTVSLETEGGRSLGFHLGERPAMTRQRWDVVVLQEYSTLDRDRPGDDAAYRQNATRLAGLFTAINPAVDVYLMATWSRADRIWPQGSPWSGQPIGRMAEDLMAAARRARAASPDIDGIIPVGLSWNAAFEAGLADPNPYDGIAYGQWGLWASDHYHASYIGSYLAALTVFGRVTGIDPRALGGADQAAQDLGLTEAEAGRLQEMAWQAIEAGR